MRQEGEGAVSKAEERGGRWQLEMAKAAAGKQQSCKNCFVFKLRTLPPPPSSLMPLLLPQCCAEESQGLERLRGRGVCRRRRRR